MAQAELPRPDTKTNKPFSQTKVLYTVIAVLVVAWAASSGLIYRQQRQQVTALKLNLIAANNKLSASEASRVALQKNNSDLQTKYQETLNQLAAATAANNAPASVYTQGDLDLTVDEAVTANVSAIVGYNQGVIAVNITLKNSTGSTIAVSPDAYEIRDADNHVYSLSFLSQTGFGKDFVPLDVTQLAPGQTVAGYIGIQIADVNVTDYTLIIGSHTYKVSATKLASFPVAN